MLNFEYLLQRFASSHPKSLKYQIIQPEPARSHSQNLAPIPPSFEGGG